MEVVQRFTGHSVEEALPGSIIGLQDFAVQRPVQVSDEAGGFTALSDLHRTRIISQL